MTKQVTITGHVTYTPGDGAAQTIPKGPVNVDFSDNSVTLSWTADNGAACDEEGGGKIACASSVGTLSFVRQAQDDLPLLRVARSGTEIAEGGKVRTLGPADSAEYRYDATSKQYQ